MADCTYCGDLAVHRDHVIPVSYRSSRHYDCHTVPSCRDCNCKILRDEPYFSVYQRTERVLEVLRDRLRDCDYSNELLALRAEYAKERLMELEPDY